MKINQITTFPNNSLSFFGKRKPENINNTQAYLSGGVAAVAVTAASVLAYRNHAGNYRVQLAKSLSKELGKKILAKDLKSVVTKNELLKELPKLKEENYVLTETNLRNGTFLADLHSHSNHSDGTISVENLLNEAAEYGDKLQKLNGKKFMFALSDHDGVDGVKEALKIIALNPKKYENIRFVPATEVSFIFPCHKDSARFKRHGSDVQMPEMLIYSINPFSETSKNFFEKIYSGREKQIEIAINDARSYFKSNEFTEAEYKKFFTNNRKPFLLNQHWKLWNYLHTKARVIAIAKEQNKDAKVLYEEIAQNLRSSGQHLTPYGLNEYIKANRIQTNSKMFDEEFKKNILSSIFPKQIDPKTAHSDFELQLKDIVEYSKKENALLGFAHPAFTMQNFSPNEIRKEMQTIVRDSRGQIKFTEKYHQAYPIGDEVTQAEIDEYNKILDELGLIHVGGRDNHKNTFFP